MLDNRAQLVGVVVQGVISSPALPAIPASPHVISADGLPRLLPPPGGIVYNVRTGDSAFGWEGDMVQPGVSIFNPAEPAHVALNILSAIGNEAIVVTGRAKGSKGTVVGKSGRFSEHVILDFAPEVLDLLAISDSIMVRALGRGMRLSDSPGSSSRASLLPCWTHLMCSLLGLGLSRSGSRLSCRQCWRALALGL